MFADDVSSRPRESLGKSFDISSQRRPMQRSVRDDFDEFFDGAIDDLKLEVDLLSELVPESERLCRLEEIQPAFQDEGQEPFMSSVRLMRDLFGVPISLMSLVYEKFQWFKAGCGLETNQTERCQSFCVHTFIPVHPQVLYVPDATKDVRFHDNALVTGPPFIRFYCGVPLVTNDNIRLGALCIIDRKPRVMSEEDMRILINLAELAIRELMKNEMAHKASTCPAPTSSPKLPTLLASPSVGMHKLATCPSPSPPVKRSRHLPSLRVLQQNRQKWFEQGLVEGDLVLDVIAPEWKVMWANPAWLEWSNRTGIGCIKQDLWGVLNPVGGEDGCHVQEQILKRIASDKSGSVRFLSKITCKLFVASKLTVCVATIATRPVCAPACTINLPSKDINEPNEATPISSAGHRLLILTVTPLSEEDAAKLNNPTVTFETPCEVGVVYEKVDLEKELSQVNFRLMPVYDTFRKLDKTATLKVSRRVLVTIFEKLGGHGAMIETLIDAAGLDQDGEICYRDLLMWLSTGAK